MAHAVITRACHHWTTQFEVGDVVENHVQADQLIALGFAEHVHDDAAVVDPAAADEVTEPSTRRERAASKQES